MEKTPNLQINTEESMHAIQIPLQVSSQRRAREVMRQFEHHVDEAFTYYHIYTDFVQDLKKTYDTILQHIPLDGVTKTCLRIVFPSKRILHYDSMQQLYDYMKAQFLFVHQHLDKVILQLPRAGSLKMKKNVYVFGHELDILNVVLQAHVQQNDIEVHITQQSATGLGREMAKELNRHNIPVHFYADLAIRQAIKKSDYVFIGAHAIDYNAKVYTTIGAEVVCQIAKEFQKPVYVITDSWAYDLEITSQTDLGKPAQLWDAPEGVQVHNYNFEKVNPKLIFGFITELGISKPSEFILKVKKEYANHF